MVLTGNCLLLLWRMTAFILTLAMVCNLRAHLMGPVTEKPINNADDVLKRGVNLWIPKVNTVGNFYSKYIPSSMVQLVDRQQTRYNIAIGGPPEHIWRDVIDNGAVALDLKVIMTSWFTELYR